MTGESFLSKLMTQATGMVSKRKSRESSGLTPERNVSARAFLEQKTDPPQGGGGRRRRRGSESLGW